METAAAPTAAEPQGTNAGAAPTPDGPAPVPTPEVAYDSGFRLGHREGLEAGVVKERLRTLRTQLQTSLIQQIVTAIGALVPAIRENDDDLFGEDAPPAGAPGAGVEGRVGDGGRDECAGGFWETLANTLPSIVEKLQQKAAAAKERDATPAEVAHARYHHLLDLLKRFGEHTDECKSPSSDCTCGWSEIAQSLEEPSPAADTKPAPAAATAPAASAPTEGQTTES